VARQRARVHAREPAALHPEFVSRTFERLVRDAGLPPIRLHDLRHGAATLVWPAERI
jgi:integrase